LSGKSQHDEMDEQQAMFGEVQYPQQVPPSNRAAGGYTQEQVDGKWCRVFLHCSDVRKTVVQLMKHYDLSVYKSDS